MVELKIRYNQNYTGRHERAEAAVTKDRRGLRQLKLRQKNHQGSTLVNVLLSRYRTTRGLHCMRTGYVQQLGDCRGGRQWCCSYASTGLRLTCLGGNTVKSATCRYRHPSGLDLDGTRTLSPLYRSKLVSYCFVAWNTGTAHLEARTGVFSIVVIVVVVFIHAIEVFRVFFP